MPPQKSRSAIAATTRSFSRQNQFELMGNESRWRNSSSEVGIAEFPSSEPTIFPELPPFWFLFGGKSLTLVCRRLPFLSCCNADCCLIIAGNDAENCAFRDPTPNTLLCRPGYERLSSSEAKIIGRNLTGRAFLLERANLIRFFWTN